MGGCVYGSNVKRRHLDIGRLSGLLGLLSACTANIETGPSTLRHRPREARRQAAARPAQAQRAARSPARAAASRQAQQERASRQRAEQAECRAPAAPATCRHLIPRGTFPTPRRHPRPEALPARTWKLTHAEYAKTVQALLGVAVDTSDLEPDLDNGVYPNMSASHSCALRSPPATTARRSSCRMGSPRHSSRRSCRAVPSPPASKPTFLRASSRKRFAARQRPRNSRPTAKSSTSAPTRATDVLGFRAVLRALAHVAELPLPNRDRRRTRRSGLHAHRLRGGVAALVQPARRPALGGSCLRGGRARSSRTRGDARHPGGGAHESPEATAQLASFMCAWLKIHHFEPRKSNKDEVVSPASRRSPGHEGGDGSFLAQYGGTTGTIPAL